MLQRRLGVEKSNTASVGDSMGDVGMFGESACAVLFNPWDDRGILRPPCDRGERSPLVLDLICDRFGLPKP